MRVLGGLSFKDRSCITVLYILFVGRDVFIVFMDLPSVCAALSTVCSKMCGRNQPSPSPGQDVSIGEGGSLSEKHSSRGQKIFLACCSCDAVLSSNETDYGTSTLSDDSTSSYGCSA